MRHILIVTFLLFSGCNYPSIPFTPQNCSVIKQNNTTTVKCPDGTEASITDGLNGPPGAPGTTVSFVQFCPGVQLVNFPEAGICVSGNIYAIYWNGSTAFGTLLPPRQYVTTAINGNCTFTVGANCNITNP